MKNTKKITALILAITMLPFSDFVELVPVRAEETIEIEETDTEGVNTGVEIVLENINLKGASEYEYRIEALDNEGILRYTSNEVYIDTPDIIDGTEDI